MACAWLIYTKPAPPRISNFARVLNVATVVVEPMVEMTPITGHGTVRPKHQVNIVPQVSGRLVRVHDNLATGRVIPQGELLFEVDPTVYESRRKQAQAEIARLEASLQRVDQEMASLDERIANVQQMLAIDKRDYETSKRLFDVDQVGTRRDVDLVYQKYLRQRDAMIEIESRRKVLPHVKLETAAQLDAARARDKQASHDLDSTKIFCPFEARVETVSAYRSQVVTAHFSIATLTDMSAFELPVGIDPSELRWLDKAIRPEALEQETLTDRPVVTVRWSLHGQSFTWRGHVTRFEQVDEATRTARLIVEVDKIDMTATTGSQQGAKGPMLAIGMHCRAELPAQRLADALTVPRHAIYDNRWVYVVEPDDDSSSKRGGRLARREVPMLRSLGDTVLVDYAGRDTTEVCELRPGDRVVVSPLLKPVEGMQVRLRNERATLWERSPLRRDPRELKFVLFPPATLAHVSLVAGGE